MSDEFVICACEPCPFEAVYDSPQYYCEFHWSLWWNAEEDGTVRNFAAVEEDMRHLGMWREGMPSLEEQVQWVETDECFDLYMKAREVGDKCKDDEKPYLGDLPWDIKTISFTKGLVIAIGLEEGRKGNPPFDPIQLRSKVKFLLKATGE